MAGKRQRILESSRTIEVSREQRGENRLLSSSIPFNIPIAHIHGGETTKGAFDDCFRHSITQMSNFHFTSSEIYKNRVIEIKGSKKNEELKKK